jgi:hypothetical protein
VAVRVVEADDALAPSVLDDSADRLDPGMHLQLLHEPVQVLGLEAHLHVVGPFHDVMVRDAGQPAEVLLQRQAAREQHVLAVVLENLESE